ncbi:MAG: hypothetical protein JXR58_13640 [Bacteroidales bacterium]|nr:hypothetical protein [Bacteroidales bacterium]
MIRAVFLFLVFCASAFPQSPEQNLAKYRNYRNRLQYFVAIGDLPGQSNIAAIRNHINHNKGTLRFGQHITYFGEYLGVLATEYKLLEIYGKERDETLTELYYAIQAYIRLDLCESKYPWRHNRDYFDGFAVRTDHSEDFLEDQKKFSNNLNINLDQENQSFDKLRNSNPGQPAYVDRIVAQTNYLSKEFSEEEKRLEWIKHSMSQDDICPLLSGLALVVKCLPDSAIIVKDQDGNSILYNFADTAKKIAILSVRFMSNIDEPYGKANWRMYRPDSSKMEWQLGGLTYFYGTGYVRALDFFSNDNPMEESVSNAQNILWQLYQIFPLPNFDNRSMLSHLGVVSDSWRFIFFNTSYSGIKKQSMINGWQPYYLMMWKFLHDKNRKVNKKMAEEHLNSAPFNGPYCYKEWEEHASGRWASSSRYWHNTKNQKYGNKHFRGNYNGTDYMLLYNLFHLIYKDELPEYEINK